MSSLIITVPVGTKNWFQTQCKVLWRRVKIFPCCVHASWNNFLFAERYIKQKESAKSKTTFWGKDTELSPCLRKSKRKSSININWQFLLFFSSDRMFVDDTPVSTFQSCLDVFWIDRRFPVYSCPARIAGWFGTLLEWNLGREDGESLFSVYLTMLVC